MTDFFPIGLIFDSKKTIASIATTNKSIKLDLTEGRTDGQRDGWTDGRSDGRTDKAKYSSARTVLTRPYTRQHQSRAGGQGQYSSWAGSVTQI